MPREVKAPRQDQASCRQDVACDAVVMGLLACLYNADLLGAVVAALLWASDVKSMFPALLSKRICGTYLIGYSGSDSLLPFSRFELLVPTPMDLKVLGNYPRLCLHLEP